MLINLKPYHDFLKDQRYDSDFVCVGWSDKQSCFQLFCTNILTIKYFSSLWLLGVVLALDIGLLFVFLPFPLRLVFFFPLNLIDLNFHKSINFKFKNIIPC